MPRTSIKDFELANPIYRGAQVTFWTVAAGAKTAVKATLYAGTSGAAQLANPQKLDSHGKFRQAVYIDVPVIGTIEGLTVPTHDTGIISPAPTFRVASTGEVQYSFDGGVSWNSTGDFFFRDRGTWAAATAYERNDMVTTSGGRYIALSDHTSSASFATDLASSLWRFFGPSVIGVSVKDYGALGDGVADDATAIQAAIDANQGNVIFFPKGTYIIGTPINLKTQRILRGEGIGSIIKASASWAPSVPTIAASTYSPVLSFAPLLYNGSAIDWWGIEDLELHGNDKDCYGLWLAENYHGHIKNVTVESTNKRPYTNIRGQSVLHTNFTCYDCAAGVITYDTTGLIFSACGFELLGTDWYYDQRQPNSYSKGGVRLDGCWFESDASHAPTEGFLRMSGRRNRADIHCAFHTAATTERLLELNDNTASRLIDGITMQAQPCVGGRFVVNDASSSMLIVAATNAAYNAVRGWFSNTLVNDDGVANTFDINASLVTSVQHVTGRFQVRAGDTGSGIPSTAANYVFDADWNAGNPIMRLLGNVNNNFSLSSGQLRLTSNSNMQMMPTGNFLLVNTDGAFLPQTLTTTQRDALTAANSMLFYNSTRGTLEGRIAGTWRALRGGQVSADNGDAAATLVVASDEPTQVWDTPLSADRAITLSTTAAANGDRFRIVRTAAATGAFNLNVGTGPLKAMGTAGSFVDVEYNGSAWFLSAYGTL